MLTSLITRAIQEAPSSDPSRHMEFEIRFGTYSRTSSNIKHGTFFRIIDTVVGRKTYQLIEETFYITSDKNPIRRRITHADSDNLVKQMFESPQTIDESKIRSIVSAYQKLHSKDIPANTVFVSKESIGKKYTTSTYTAAMATEVTHPHGNGTHEHIKKYKLRCSWQTDMWIHDMTVLLIDVDQRSGVFYEAEIELDVTSVIKNKNTFDDVLDNAVNHINTVTTIIDCAKIGAVEVEMRYGIYNAVSTLERKDLDKLQHAKYAVVDKADGERKFIHIDTKNIAWQFNPTEGIIAKTQIGVVAAGLSDTLIDCELIDETKFYGFDILFFNGTDCRSRDLNQRLTLLSKVINTLSKGVGKVGGSIAAYEFKLKKFYTDDVFKNAERIWVNRMKLFPYNLDGLIFTPIRGAYLGNLPNFKYKPLVSVDVRLMYDKNNDFTEFNAMGYPVEIKGRIVNAYADYKTKKIFYKSRVTVNDDKLKKMGVVNSRGVLGMRGRVANIPDMSVIVEMEFNPETGMWKFLRTRPDKENPNAFRTITSAASAIADNITIDELSKLSHIKSALEKINDENASCFTGVGYNFIAPNITSDICDFYSSTYTTLLDTTKGKSILVLGADMCVINGLLKSAYTNIVIIENNCLEVYGTEKSEGYSGLIEHIDRNGRAAQQSGKKISVVWGDVSISDGLLAYTKQGQSVLKSYTKFDTVFINNFETALYHGKKFDRSNYKKYMSNISQLSGTIIGQFLSGSTINKHLEKQHCLLMRNRQLHPLYKIYLAKESPVYSSDDIFKETPRMIEVQRMQNSYTSECQPLVFDSNIRFALKSEGYKVGKSGSMKSFLPAYKQTSGIKINEYDSIIADITQYFVATM